MSKRLAALSLGVAAAILAACTGRGGPSTTGGSSYLLPSSFSNVAIVATLPSDTVGEELPSEGVGTIADPFWKATLGGFTQTNYSQALGFPPNTKITVENLSKDISHTFNFVKKIKGPPANFPSNPSLSTQASGGNFKKGYASGSISPGKSVSVMLAKAGVYLIGCAFHYGEGMHDVLVVKKSATPGPEGTPPAQ